MAMFARPLLAVLLLPAFLLSAASAADSKGIALVTFSRCLVAVIAYFFEITPFGAFFIKQWKHKNKVSKELQTGRAR